MGVWRRFLAGSVLTLCLGTAPLMAAPLAAVGQAVTLPAISLADGGKLEAGALRGKALVIAWFATYCPYCAQEAPRLERLYAAHGQQLLVIGVNVEGNDPGVAAQLRQWTTKYGWTFPVTQDVDALARVLGKPKGIPALMVIDRLGIVRQIENGELLDEDYDDIAASALR